ncbi:ph-response sensor protein [Saitoella coloradoensis]
MSRSSSVSSVSSTHSAHTTGGSAASSNVTSRSILPPFRRAVSNLLNGPTDFYIRLAEPHRISFSPGEVVRGEVIIGVARALKALSLKLRFAGKVKINGLLRGVECASIFEGDDIVLLGERRPAGSSMGLLRRKSSDAPERTDTDWVPKLLEEGEHVFSFEVTLPARNLPTSLDFGKGSILYMITADLRLPWSIAKHRFQARRTIPVRDLIDIADVPIPKPKKVTFPISPGSLPADGKGARIEALIELDRAGVLKGGTLGLSVRVHHVRPIKTLRGVIVTLYRLSRVYSGNSHHSASDLTFRKDLVQSVHPLLCDPRSLSCAVFPRLRIPTDTFPTIQSAGRAASFRYYVEVLVDLSGKTTVWQGGNNVGAEEVLESVMFGGQAGVQGDFSGGNSGATYDDEASLSKGQGLATDRLRGEKGVCVVAFEVTVGTVDSSENRAGATSTGAASVGPSSPPELTGESADYTTPPPAPPPVVQTPVITPPPLAVIALPEIAHDQIPTRDEKRVLRDAEAALLPSVPPPAASSSRAPDYVSAGSYEGYGEGSMSRPSAPFRIPSYMSSTESGSMLGDLTRMIASPGPSAPPSEVDHIDYPAEGSSRPSSFTPPLPRGHIGAAEEKERLRAAEAALMPSAPPVIGYSNEELRGVTPQPSAPVDESLNENDGEQWWILPSAPAAIHVEHETYGLVEEDSEADASAPPLDWHGDSGSGSENLESNTLQMDALSLQEQKASSTRLASEDAERLPEYVRSGYSEG